MQVYTDPDGSSSRPPVFRRGFPLIVLYLTGAIIAVSAFQLLASPETVDWMFSVAAIAAGPSFEGVYRPWGDFAPLILHSFLHGGVFHLAMNMAALLSFGPILAMALGQNGRGTLLFLLFFCVCAIGGAWAQIAWYDLRGIDGLAIGASSALSGFLPAIGYLRTGWRGAWTMSVPWIVINMILAVTGGINAFPIAWAAHLGGLAAGFSFPFFLGFARR